MQTELSNYFKSNIIDFLKDSENTEYIKKNLSKYLNYNINNFIFDFSNNTSTINNGIVELTILSKVYSIEIIIFDNFNKIIYVILNGEVIYDFINKNTKISTSKYKDSYLKNTINILYEYSGGYSNPNKVKVIYYI